jgi:hypothetical protein
MATLQGLCVRWCCAVLLTAQGAAAATYYVDDDAPGDPGPHDPAVSDPLEDGSLAHPFDEVDEAIDAATGGDFVFVQPGIYFEHLSMQGKEITLASLQGPEVTILDGSDAGRVLSCQDGEGPGTVIDGFTITGGSAQRGGGVRIYEADPVFSNCEFLDNFAEVGGAVDVLYSLSVFHRCRFVGNVASAGGGAVTGFYSVLTYRDCEFLANSAPAGGAVVSGDDPESTWINCRFVANSVDGAFTGGSAVVVENGRFVNCLFSRNESGAGGRGALSAVWDITLVNCTFSHNVGFAIAATATPANVTASNCIIWGNTDGTIVDEYGGAPGFATVYHSDIEGGWTGAGSGNIDADPLFVQPGTDDVRLAFGSPCVDAGDNASVPPDITTDIDGVDRFLNGIVDMGAHEGEYDALPPAEAAYDLDPGEFAMLYPDGEAMDFFESRGVFLVNTGGTSNATAVLTILDEEQHPTAVGYTSPGRLMCLETTMQEGGFSALSTFPITAADLDGLDPALLDLTVYVPSADSWALAVSENMQNAPGDDDPIGERHVQESLPVSQDIGAYGVVWDPQQQKGFVWANLDFNGDFAFGVPRCPSDCAQPPSGVTDGTDILALFAEWGEGAGPFDVNNDEIVDALDLLGVIGAWGICTE